MGGAGAFQLMHRGKWGNMHAHILSLSETLVCVPVAQPAKVSCLEVV